MEIQFRVDRPAGRRSAFAPIAEALRESGTALAESVASLILFIVTVIPWLVLVLPAVWLLGKLWRRLRRKRAGLGFAPPEVKA